MSRLAGSREITTRCPSQDELTGSAASTKQPSLSGVTPTSKTPPAIRALFPRLKRGPNRGREKTSLCLSYSGGSKTSSDHDLPIERGAGTWNCRVPGVLPPREDSGTGLRAGDIPESRLSKSKTSVQPASGRLCDRILTPSAARVFSEPSARDTTPDR